jgi:acyl carrier protein
MDREQVMVTMREVAPEVLGVEPDVVVEEANFKDDLDADSLDLVELVMGLEERLDVVIPEDELAGITTVGQAVDLVVAKLAVKT